ncbi:sugar phosphate permease [Homoserinimonas aerilata]|uniref:Sugar phosphate permease n=1 Tax=Homoserinimonas aerilata TaxID=1162970 RepID=A0A542XX94_9MICO|nr:MFS transporter [Homoserinimonas aerilata]TQL40454.1 sugar phosphate permease [Homoserinimonas aerilata]
MYISFSDRPRGGARPTTGAGARVSSVVIALGVVSMLTDVSSESVAAILPLYVTGVIGLSTVAYGFIDGIYQGVSALVRIAGGYAADRGDQPKWVAFFGYGVSALARVGLLFASGFAALTAVLAIDRLGKGVRTAPRDALIAASSHPDALGRAFGMHRMLDTIGAALGPLIAFVILLLIPDGFSTIFVVSLAFALLGLAVLGFIVPNRRPRAEAPVVARPAKRFSLRELRDPRLRRLLLVAALFGLLTVGDGFIYLVLQGRGSFAAEWFPLLYVGTNVAFLALAVPVGRLADRVGRARIFVIGHVALLAAYVSAALPVAGAPITIACLLLLGVFYAATDGIIAALATQFTPVSARASGIAAAQTVVAVCRFFASTGFGLLWFFAGRANAVIVVAVALAVVIPFAAWLLRQATRRPPDEGPPDDGTPDEGTPDEGTADEGTSDERPSDEGTADDPAERVAEG